MKTKNIIRICGVAMMSAVCLSSCDYVLEEQPHSSYDPSYFKTKDGVEGVINQKGELMTEMEALDYEGYLVGEYNSEF